MPVRSYFKVVPLIASWGSVFTVRLPASANS
jgi:hypothetical protein